MKTGRSRPNNRAGIAHGARVEHVTIATLKPNPNNARIHPKRQIKALAHAFEHIGIINPVLVDGEANILAGHARVLAAAHLGMRAVPVLRVEHLTEAQKRAYVLGDNRLAEMSGWDREVLASELQALVDLNFDLSLTGFESAEIDISLDEADEARGNDDPEDVLPPVKQGKAVTRPGDCWILRNHRLFCGDARDPSAYETLLKGKKAEFTFSDPPYNVKIDGHVSGLGRIRHKNFAMACGEMSKDEFTRFLTTTFELLADNTMNGAVNALCIDWRHMEEMLAAGRKAFGELLNVCIWNKTNAGMGSLYRSKYEMVFIWKHGKASHTNNVQLGQFGRSRSNVWDYAGVNVFRQGRHEELVAHPTVKPVRLVADAIRDCSKRGELVLDPFVGSGTTILAAEKTGRQARGIEIDPGYVDLAVRRWQGYTGKQAILAETDRSFEEVEENERVRSLR